MRAALTPFPPPPHAVSATITTAAVAPCFHHLLIGFPLPLNRTLRVHLEPHAGLLPVLDTPSVRDVLDEKHPPSRFGEHVRSLRKREATARVGHLGPDPSVAHDELHANPIPWREFGMANAIRDELADEQADVVHLVLRDHRCKHVGSITRRPDPRPRASTRSTRSSTSGTRPRWRQSRRRPGQRWSPPRR